VGQDGVVARPLCRFFSEGQVMDTRMQRISKLKVVEATEKLDGTMVDGAKDSRNLRPWTRSGFTTQAVTINRWASEQGELHADAFELLAEVEEKGATTSFEWVGRQSRIERREHF